MIGAAKAQIAAPPIEEAVPSSFFMAGFECSTHRRRDGARLDVISATRHDRHAASDYRLMKEHGLSSVRDGLRWHLIERQGGRYDWSSWLPMLEAAEAAGVQVIWDIWHYGTPDDVDVWSPRFVERLAAFAEAAARLHREVTDRAPLWCPLNEISFYSFIAGEVGDFHPYGHGRGYELKCQLVRAAIVVADSLRAIDPRCRLLWAEPLINVLPLTGSAEDEEKARGFHFSQYQVFDMLTGRLEPDLGGRPELLDLVGCNFYPHNQWALGGSAIPFGHHAYRPLADLLHEVHARYGRPMIIAETGAEGSARAPWLHYVCQEVAEAAAAGIPVDGVCLYPIAAYPGWDDDRDCHTGLFGAVAEDGGRAAFAPLLAEINRRLG